MVKNKHKLTKAQLIEQLELSEGTVARQETTIKRLEREAGQKDAKITTLSNRKAPTVDDQVKALEGVIQQKEAVNKKLVSWIQDFIGVSADLIGGVKAVVNLGDNNIKNIIEEIQKG